MNNSNSGFELLIERIIAFQALFSHSIWFAVSLEKKIRRKENYPESWKDFLLELQSLLSKQNQQLPEALSFLEEPFSLFSAWAPAGGFGLMATAGTSMWPICLHCSHLSFCSFTLWHDIGGQWKYSFLSKNRVPVWEQVRFALCENITGFVCASPHITPF